MIENDSQKAAENYELALTFDDRSLAALRQIARIAEESGDYEKALAYLIRAKLEAPDDPDVLFTSAPWRSGGIDRRSERMPLRAS